MVPKVRKIEFFRMIFFGIIAEDVIHLVFRLLERKLVLGLTIAATLASYAIVKVDGPHKTVSL